MKIVSQKLRADSVVTKIMKQKCLNVFFEGG